VPEGHDFTIPADTPYKPDELIVRFAPKVDSKQRNTTEKIQVLSSLGGGTIKREYKIVPGLSLVKLPPGLTVEDALKTYNATDEILYAEPDYEIPLLSTFPNDSRFDELWGMHNTGQTGGTDDADIDAPEAWDIIHDACDIIVAVIDTGVDYTHPDLAANIWINEAELNGESGVDDDENGYVDDIRGWDFYDDDNDPMDYRGHGTHCAGTIGAIGNNSEGVVGVCWNVKLMAVHISHYATEGWVTFASNAAEGIEYAVENGAKVLSNSWGGPTHVQALKDAIDGADANGVIFVAAVGNDYGNNNDSNPVYPCSYDCNNIISVMATDHTDEVAYYSNYGPTSVDIGAPGGETNYSEDEGILSTIPYEGYAFYQGTSMAAPHVAGACALVWAARPNFTYLQVKDAIMQSADPLASLDGLCVSGGRLNLYNAVKYKAPFPDLILEKDDDVGDSNCVGPGDYITYTISYDANGTDVNDVNIVDHLPEQVYFSSAPDGGIYDLIFHTVTWELGDLDFDDSGSVTLTVKVSKLAEPNSTITNLCEIEDEDNYYYISAAVDTKVCCWKTDIIYVDADRWAGSDTGMSWDNAYLNLQDALKAARDCGCNEIWVAEGTYYTHTDTDEAYYDIAFELVNGIPVYGGFGGNETSRGSRNRLTNETILEGDINGDGDSETNYIIKAVDVNEATILDGFTLRKGYYAAIQIDGGSPIIKHNKVSENFSKGIECIEQSSPDITNCQIQGNIGDIYKAGIYCEDSDANIACCIIKDNGGHGIKCSNSDANITLCLIGGNTNNGIYGKDMSDTSAIVMKNNWIYKNGGSGINLYCGEEEIDSVIQNNTIVDNDKYGVESPSYFEVLTNCIIWGNDSGSLKYHDHNVKYSCIEDGYAGGTNISANPLFYNDPNDPNNYHLDVNSPCIDAGDLSFTAETDETDIDGEERVVNGCVDMGADEYYWSPADFDEDGNVNFIDYAVFAAAWKSESGQGNYNDDCDLEDNNSIDYNDLALFCDDWLWVGGWTQEFMMMMYGGMGMQQGDYSESVSEPFGQTEEQTSQAEELEGEFEEPDLAAIIEYIDMVWLSGDLKESMTEEQYLEFRKAIEEWGL